MNKKLGPGTLILLSLALLYLGGISRGSLGAGLAVGGLVCFVASIVTFIQKIFRRNEGKTLTNEDMNNIGNSTTIIGISLSIIVLFLFFWALSVI